MKTYHPPMTGLEAEMEAQIARQAHRPTEAQQDARELRAKQKATTPRKATLDRETEEAMHLGR